MKELCIFNLKTSLLTEYCHNECFGDMLVDFLAIISLIMRIVMPVFITVLPPKHFSSPL